MDGEDFKFYQKMLYEKSGLALTAEKTYLLESRLAPIVRNQGLNTLQELTKILKTAPGSTLLRQVIDAMMTNETLFFRDQKPFTQFRTAVLPALLKSRLGKKSLKIWSAACSTGQEPYSVAMILQEDLPILKDWSIDFLATDISDAALSHARKAEYNQFEIQRGLPINMVMKYFKQDGSIWALDKKIRDMIRFESFNLLERMDRFGTFDVVFCRNVLIYFDEETKKRVLSNLVKKLAPDGFLFLGGSETVIGLCPDLKGLSGCPGLYTLQSSSFASVPIQPAPQAAQRSVAP